MRPRNDVLRRYRAAIDACDASAPELFLEFAEWAEACAAADAARPAPPPGGDEAPLDVGPAFELESEGPLFRAAPSGADAAAAALEAAAAACHGSVLVVAARAALLERLDRPAEAEAALEALVKAAPLTDDPDAGDGEVDAAPWILLERHARRHHGIDAARRIFARTADLREAGKIDCRIYEAHAMVEARCNKRRDVARRCFQLGLDQRPELLTRHDATYALAFAAFLEADCGDPDEAVAVLERAVQAHEKESDAPAALWDGLVSLHHRCFGERDAAARARRVEQRRKAAGKGGVGGVLGALWRDVSSSLALPLNDVDTAWRSREAVAATQHRDVASVRDVAAALGACRADGLLADEIDNGGLVEADLDAEEGDEVGALISALPARFRRLADRVHRKARRAVSDPRTVRFVLDALQRGGRANFSKRRRSLLDAFLRAPARSGPPPDGRSSRRRAPLPPPPSKKRGRADDDDDDAADDAAPDAFRARRAAAKVAKAAA